MNEPTSICSIGMYITSFYVTSILTTLRARALRDHNDKCTRKFDCCKRELAVASAAAYCLACGQATMANRRLLNSESSSSVQKAWRNLLDERLKEKEMELDMDLVLIVSAPNYVCK